MTHWSELDANHCWHPFTRHQTAPKPLEVVRAQKATLELSDGRYLLDAIASWWACLLGHAHPRLVEVIARQAAQLDHVLFAGCTHEPAARLASELVNITPQGLNRVFFSDDGSTAVEVALKMAVQAWRRRGQTRTHFVALNNGYHGDTFGAMSAGEPGQYFAPFGPLLFEVTRVPPEASALEKVLQARSDIAAFIFEPGIQGAGGMTPISKDFTLAARRLCDEFGIFMIADEVFTGFGRTGYWFACDEAGISPDILCVAKALTNGMYPLSATLSTEELYTCFQGSDPTAMLLHGHTMTANPVGCALARETIMIAKEIDAPALYQANAKLISDALAAHQPSDTSGRSTQLRTMGGVVALELGQESGYLSSLGPKIAEACRQEDVLLRPLGNIIYAVPPLCVTADECARIGESMARVAVRALA